MDDMEDRALEGLESRLLTGPAAPEAKFWRQPESKDPNTSSVFSLERWRIRSQSNCIALLPQYSSASLVREQVDKHAFFKRRKQRQCDGG
jgi:hypothetical protein